MSVPCLALVRNAAAASALLAAMSVAAHHSFSGQFNIDDPVSIEGVVTRVEWQNPHVWFYVDATDEDGNVVHWEAETTNPNTLLRRGWKADDLKVGDRVSVDGARAFCCDNVMNARTVTLPDGRRVFSRDGR
ncbi:DUF6152 family protein [Candidatus Rariloculus sp.]|uniref:DUF6152 family protein n=1 Tax=Candidatus Rariloculus sp. TaxID=3101265 RepID=UPI003D09640F